MILIDRHPIAPLPMISAHIGPNLEMIEEAIREARRTPDTMVIIAGTPYFRGGPLYAVFESLAYPLQCARRRDDDGFTSETVPTRPRGSLVGCCQAWEPGRILRLARFRFVAGDYVFRPQWEPMWLVCAWHSLDAVR